MNLMKKARRFIPASLTIMMAIAFMLPAYAVDGGADWIAYTDNNFTISYPAITEEEYTSAQYHMNLHEDAMTRHPSGQAHTHSIINARLIRHDSFIYTPAASCTNNNYANGVTVPLPVLTWSTGESFTVEKRLQLSVNVPEDVAAVTLGAEYAKSHEVTNTISYSFSIPYMQKGRIEVTYQRPYKEFTCVTTYYYHGSSETYQETGPGTSYGGPINIDCHLTLRNI